MTALPRKFATIHTIEELKSLLGLQDDRPLWLVKLDLKTRCKAEECPYPAVVANDGHCVLHGKSWWPSKESERGHFLLGPEFLPYDKSRLSCCCEDKTCYGIGYSPFGLIRVPANRRFRKEILFAMKDALPDSVKTELKKIKHKSLYLAPWHFYPEHRTCNKITKKITLVNRGNHFFYPPPNYPVNKFLDEMKEMKGTPSPRKSKLPRWVRVYVAIETGESSSPPPSKKSSSSLGKSPSPSSRSPAKTPQSSESPLRPSRIPLPGPRSRSSPLSQRPIKNPLSRDCDLDLPSFELESSRKGSSPQMSPKSSPRTSKIPLPRSRSPNYSQVNNKSPSSGANNIPLPDSPKIAVQDSPHDFKTSSRKVLPQRLVESPIRPCRIPLPKSRSPLSSQDHSKNPAFTDCGLAASELKPQKEPSTMEANTTGTLFSELPSKTYPRTSRIPLLRSHSPKYSQGQNLSHSSGASNIPFVECSKEGVQTSATPVGFSSKELLTESLGKSPVRQSRIPPPKLRSPISSQKQSTSLSREYNLIASQLKPCNDPHVEVDAKKTLPNVFPTASKKIGKIPLPQSHSPISMPNQKQSLSMGANGISLTECPETLVAQESTAPSQNSPSISPPPPPDRSESLTPRSRNPRRSDSPTIHTKKHLIPTTSEADAEPPKSESRLFTLDEPTLKLSKNPATKSRELSPPISLEIPAKGSRISGVPGLAFRLPSSMSNDSIGPHGSQLKMDKELQKTFDTTNRNSKTSMGSTSTACVIAGSTTETSPELGSVSPFAVKSKSILKQISAKASPSLSKTEAAEPNPKPSITRNSVSKTVTTTPDPVVSAVGKSTSAESRCLDMALPSKRNLTSCEIPEFKAENGFVVASGERTVKLIDIKAEMSRRCQKVIPGPTAEGGAIASCLAETSGSGHRLPLGGLSLPVASKLNAKPDEVPESERSTRSTSSPARSKDAVSKSNPNPPVRSDGVNASMDSSTNSAVTTSSIKNSIIASDNKSNEMTKAKRQGQDTAKPSPHRVVIPLRAGAAGSVVTVKRAHDSPSSRRRADQFFQENLKLKEQLLQMQRKLYEKDFEIEKMKFAVEDMDYWKEECHRLEGANKQLRCAILDLKAEMKMNSTKTNSTFGYY
jgi:hypothetical protein